MPTSLSDATVRLLRNKDVAAGYAERTAVIAVADLCRQMRNEAGLTQNELAKRLDIKQARIAKIESAQVVHGPSINVLSRVAAACGKRLVIMAEEEETRNEVVAAP